MYRRNPSIGVVSSTWLSAFGVIQHLADGISTNTKSEPGVVKCHPLTFGLICYFGSAAI